MKAMTEPHAKRNWAGAAGAWSARHRGWAVASWLLFVVVAMVIGSAIVSALDKLDLRFPRADPASLEEFKKVRKALENEGKASAVAKAKG